MDQKAGVFITGQDCLFDKIEIYIFGQYRGLYVSKIYKATRILKNDVYKGQDCLFGKIKLHRQ